MLKKNISLKINFQKLMTGEMVGLVHIKKLLKHCTPTIDINI
jgi:hypothetical protein